MARTEPASVVLDAGAVIALARGDRVLRAKVESARRGGAEFSVPMVVLAETVRGNGPRDAPVNRVLAGFAPHRFLDEATARTAGTLLARARSSATVDALVAAEAIRLAPSTVFTADPDHLEQLLCDEPLVVVQQV